MTAEQWVKETISSKVVGDSIMLDGGGLVAISTFCTFFRTALEDDIQTDKYVALSGSHTFPWTVYNSDGTTSTIQVTRSAEELGYQPTFDAWHSEGLV